MMVYLRKPEKGCVMVHYIILSALLVCADFRIFLQFMGIAFINVVIKFCACPILSNRMPALDTILLRPNSSSYGMPSGHCQLFFALIAYLRPKDPLYFMLAVCYGCLIGHERVVENKHTVFQTIVGSFLGYSLGLCVN